MDNKRNKKIVIWLSVATLLGVGGYFAYTKIIKPKLDEMKAKKAAEEAANLAASTAASSTPSNGSASSSQVPPNPLYPDDLLKFQNYVLTKDKNILGSTGADGKWGRNSWNAYQKYYNDWKASLGGSAPKPPSNTNPLFNKGVYTNTILVNLFKSPDPFALAWDTKLFINDYVGRYISEEKNAIGTTMVKVFKDGKYWYVHKRFVTIK